MNIKDIIHNKYVQAIFFFVLGVLTVITMKEGTVLGFHVMGGIFDRQCSYLILTASFYSFIEAVQSFLGVQNKLKTLPELLFDRTETKQLRKETDEAMERLAEAMGKKYNSLPQAALDKYIHIEERYTAKQYSKKLLEEILDLMMRVERYEGTSSRRDYSGNEGKTENRRDERSGRTWTGTNPTARIIAEYSFYTDCNNLDEVKKKYHKLSRMYHPDNTMTGNEEIFMELDAQYTELCNRIS